MNAKSIPGNATGKPPRGEGTDYVYLALRNLIVRLELAPGQKIEEAAIVKQLGVSRTPVREALVRLSADKLVTILPNRGAQVAPLDALGLTQYFETLELSHRALQHWACLRRTESDLGKIGAARDVYEKAAASRDAIAMSEANLEFHHAIAGAARNEFLAEFVLKLSVLGMRIGWIWYRDFTEGQQNKEISRTVSEHRLIVTAIENRDVNESERLAQLHIEAFRDRIFSKLSMSLGSAVPIR